jgi:hypothetical protein
MLAKKVVVCILLSLFLALFSGITVNSATASKVAMQWGHLNYQLQTYNLTRFNNELSWENTICSSVNSMFSSSWLHANSYGSSTTPTNVYNVLDNVANPSNGVTWSTTFWVGDFTHPWGNPVPLPFGYFGCFTNVTNSYVWDYEIYPRTTAYGASKQYFTFMWTCANGGLYWNPIGGLPGYNSTGGFYDVSGIITPVVSSTKPTWVPTNLNNIYGRSSGSSIVGMPYAWAGTLGMSINGYSSTSGSYTYIGWENSSPFMIDTPPAGSTSTNLQYLYFVYYFYRSALGIETGTPQTITDSLNRAAELTFGSNYSFGTSILNTGQWFNEPNFPGFEDKWFYCRLRVYGNGNMVLPT